MGARGGLTDEEMAALEAQHGVGLTDEEIERKELAAAAPLAVQGKHSQLAGVIRSARARTNRVATKDNYDNLTDLPGMARSAAMGFTSNMGSRPEELLKTLTEPGQNPGWATEHPEVHDKYMQSVDEHPLANIAGAVAQPNPLGGLKAATTLGKVGLAAARTGYAGANGKLAQYMGQTGPQAQDTGLLDGAKLPMALQAATEVASPTLSKVLAPAMEKAEGMRSLQAVGTRAGIKDALRAKGIGPAEAPALGKQMMDAGLVPTGLNPFKNPVEQTAQRADDLMSKSGGEVGATLDDFMKSGRADYPRAQADMRAALPRDNAVAMSQAGKAKALIDQVGEQGQLTPDSIHGLNKAKSTAWSATNFKDDAPLAAANYRAATSGLRASIENQVGDELGAAAKKNLIQSNQNYGTAADANDLAQNAMSRDLQRTPFATQKSAVASLLGGGLGFVAGGPVGAGAGGAAAAGVNHLIATRGPNIAAHANRLGAKAANALAPVINQAPAASAATGGALERYMNPPPQDDDEKQKQAAEHFTSTMGGG